MAEQPSEVKRSLVPGQYGPYTIRLIGRLEVGRPGNEVTYADLSDLCRRDVSQGNGMQNLLTARRYVERVHGLVWAPVWGQGKLRCLPEEEKLATAEGQRQAVRRKSGRMIYRLHSIDRAGLDEDQRRKHGQLLTAAMVVAAFSDGRAQKALPSDNGATRKIDTARLIEALKND